MEITIKYEKDDEMISAYCLKDQIKSTLPDSKITLCNPEDDIEFEG